MFRGSITKLSSRKKLIILASVAVLLPLVLLSFVQYRSLVELENKTKGAFKENLRQTLLNVERQIEGKFEAIASRSLIPVGSIKLSSEEARGQFEKYFSTVKQSHPEIDQIFVFSDCGCEKEEDKYAYVYSDRFLKIEHFDLKNLPETHNVLHSFDKSQTAQNFLDESRKFLFWQHFCPVCFANGRAHQATYVFYPLMDVSNGKHIGFAGLALNEAYIRDELLARSISEALNSPNLAIPNSDVVVSISDENHREIYTNSPGNHEYIIETSFSSPFANWKAEIGFKNTNLDSLARNSFWQSLAITFLVLAFLLAGIVLMIRATDREVRVAQAKSAFVSNVSHELKTPLSLISLFAELLELGRVKNDEKKREYYRIIGDESRRLSKLIDNILDFSKIEGGRKQYNFVYADIGELIESVLSGYHYQIINSGFELKTNIESNLSAVLIDRDAIAQAVLNLLDNAVKYSAEVKEISIEVKTRDSNLTIEIADRGMGIPSAEQKKIFEKFYRVSNGLVHDVKGSGLGLSLVRHIVEAHKGKILLESEVGKGTRFFIYLPIEPETANQPSQNAQAGEVYKVAENTNH
jgi:signal transduction histidine kinase